MAAPSRSPLRGRDRELVLVRRSLSQVQAGTGCVVVVEGSARLGKTRLLDECASMAAELSFLVGLIGKGLSAAQARQLIATMW